jgi:hypothetical protein
VSGKQTSETAPQSVLPVARLARLVVMFRGEKVMLDRDLAELYGVEIRVLNQAVRRNRERFPADFAFELNRGEIRELSKLAEDRGLSRVRGVFAFTEQGVAMLSSVLRSSRAVQVNIAIMRTFVQLRQMLASHADLARKLAALEGKYDKQFRVVFDAIRALMTEKKKPCREIGFHTLMPKPANAGGAKAKKI